MFYLTMQSTEFLVHFYGVGHMVKDHSYKENKPSATTIWATLSENKVGKNNPK